MQNHLPRPPRALFALVVSAALVALAADAALAQTPTVDSISPDAGPVGAPVTISGAGFSNASAVLFNGASATFAVDSDSQITATVPDGATTGPISVVTPEGTATSAADFRVQPNIVLILTDDQRWDQMGRMPTLQQDVVQQGTEFTNGFVVNSLCCPSRATILTGEYSHSTGVYTDSPPYGGFAVFDDSSTIATWLRGAGYRTALIGKYLNGYSGTYIPPGWDRWSAFSKATGSNGAYYNYTLSTDGVLTDYGNSAADYSTDVLATQAEGFIRETPASEPLFLYLAPFAPHNRPIPPQRYADAFPSLAHARPPNFNEANVSDKPHYIRKLPLLTSRSTAKLDAIRRAKYQTLLAVDDSIGGIVDALSSTGRLSDTFILFMSDNGIAAGEHRWSFKLVPYEESIRVPFVVRYDPLGIQGARSPALVANIDVAPTFADLAGVSAPGAEGTSLLPLLEGTATSWRTDFLVEHKAYRVTKADPPTYCAVRSATKLFVHYADGEEEIYGLVRDPYELKNHAGAPRWKRRLDRMRARARELCQPLPPGMPPF